MRVSHHSIGSDMSPHENTTGEGVGGESNKQPLYHSKEESADQFYASSSLDEMAAAHEEYYQHQQQQYELNSSTDSGYVVHDSQQRTQPPQGAANTASATASYYPVVSSDASSVYSTHSYLTTHQMGYYQDAHHHHHYMVPAPGPPPSSYYGHHHHHHHPLYSSDQQSVISSSHHHPPPHMIHRGSLSSSYSSSFDTYSVTGGSSGGGGVGSSRTTNRRSNNNNHNNRNNSSQPNNKPRRGYNKHGGSYGSPPNHTWYRFDPTTTFYQMKGRIIEIAKDRDGSKFIQRRLQNCCEPSEIQIVYDEAIVDIDTLWDDVYGNYILQGMLDFGTDEMRLGIGRKLLEGNNVVMLSMKVYGCRLIQKALNTLPQEDVANIVSSLKGNVWLLVHDHNGNHVIQRSIIKINELVTTTSPQSQPSSPPYEEEEENDELALQRSSLVHALDIIIEEITNSINDLVIHPYGCRVVQRLIEHCFGEQKTKVLDCIFNDNDTLPQLLMNHEYGNYVIQRALTYGRRSDKVRVFETIVGNDIMLLSKQKHSSNVVEMMLTYGDVGQRHQIIESILDADPQTYEGKNTAISMAEDAYANYVLRTSIDVLEDNSPLKERLFSMLLLNMEDLERSPFAKQVVLRVKTCTGLKSHPDMRKRF